MAVSQSISLTQGSQSVENNTTQVTFKWTSTQSGESWNGYTKTAYYYVSINGGAETKYSVSYDLPKSSTTTIASKTFTVKHKDNGEGSISIRTWMDTGISAGVIQKSKSLSLTTIPRASTLDSLSCSTSYFNGTLTYKYSPKSATFYNRCNISLNLNGDYIAVKTISIGQKSVAQQTGTVTLSDSELSTIYNKLTKTTKGILRFTFRTYSDSGYSSQVGDAPFKEVTLTIPTTVAPKLGTVTLDPVNITTLDETSRDILVQEKNKIKVSVSGCEAGAGSSIKSYTFAVLSGSTTIATTTTTGTSTIFGPFSKTGSLKFRVAVTDNRSRTTSNSGSEKTQTCYAYSTPLFSSFKAYRCNSSGTADENGTYVKYSLNVSSASVNSTNKSTVKIYYKKSTASSWTAATNALTNSTSTSATSIIKNSSGTSITFDANSTYLVYATITDNYGGSTNSSTATVFGASRIFNIRANGTGIAFGKMAESDNLLESKWPVKVDSTLSAKGSIVTGNDFGNDEAYNNSNFAMYCQWADGNNHDIMVRSTDGLTMGLGWAGNDSYPTILDVRPKKVKFRGDIVGGIRVATDNNTFQGRIYNDDSSGQNLMYFMTGQNTSNNAEAGVGIGKTSFYVPGDANDGILSLGYGSRKWNQLFAANSTISTSDRNKKKDIENMSDIQEDLFNQLKPVTYKMINGTSDRTHYGFIAQDVEDALSEIGIDSKDFAGFCKDVRVDEGGNKVLDENGNEIHDYSLRYAEFIALNTYMIQKLQNEIAELKAEIKTLKEAVQN